ncbi:mitochondrial 2-oxoglutarate malate carrier [Cyclospora cayetanensis]|uniref:Mitochondrial 2-oxoglutarate malate carrier n=1 Tax=Cyclospora cayetanensis TaxID=88456 RepID=A0A1D3CT34_9EIME|nr:mitochondrial 2-oxoglutarate malate carrier [Cyclospora cayetanensis]
MTPPTTPKLSACQILVYFDFSRANDANGAVVDSIAPVDVAALTAELARLEESQENVLLHHYTSRTVNDGGQVYQLAIGKAGTLHYTDKHYSKLLEATTRPKAVDLRL